MSGENECPFDDGLAYDPNVAYPFCQWEGPGGYERFCPETETAWAYMNWNATASGSTVCHDGPDCNACACFLGCNAVVVGGCPAAEAGTAPAECLRWNPDQDDGACFLTCDSQGAMCPDGMQCVSNWEVGRSVCAWVTSGVRCTAP